MTWRGRGERERSEEDLVASFGFEGVVIRFDVDSFNVDAVEVDTDKGRTTFTIDSGFNTWADKRGCARDAREEDKSGIDAAVVRLLSKGDDIFSFCGFGGMMSMSLC